MKVLSLSALGTGRSTLRIYSWYSFLFEAESTPGPKCGRNCIDVQLQIIFKSLNSPQYTIPKYVGIFFCGITDLLGPRPPHGWGFEIPYSHTTIGRTPLDEETVRRRDFYQVTLNVGKRRISMPTAWLVPAIPGSELTQNMQEHTWQIPHDTGHKTDPLFFA